MSDFFPRPAPPENFTIEDHPFAPVHRFAFYTSDDITLIVEAPDDWEKFIVFDVENVTRESFALKNIRLDEQFGRNVTECRSKLLIEKDRCLTETADEYEIPESKFKTEIDLAEAYPVNAPDRSASKGTVNLFANDSVTIRLPEKFGDSEVLVQLGFGTINISAINGRLIDTTQVLYGDGTGASKMRIATPEGYGTENVTSDTVSPASAHQWEKIVKAPNRNETIYISQSVNGHQMVQVFNGTTEGKFEDIDAAGVNDANLRYIDCAYNNESVAYCVRFNSTTQLHLMRYEFGTKTWRNLSAPASCSGLSNIRLFGSENLNMFVLGCETALNGSLTLQIYDGQAGTWSGRIQPANLTDIRRKPSFDCPWDPETHNWYCFYANGTVNNAGTKIPGSLGNLSVIKMNPFTKTWTNLPPIGLINRTNYTVSSVVAKAAPRGSLIPLAVATNDSLSTNGTMSFYVYDTETESILTGNTQIIATGTVEASTNTYYKVFLGDRTNSANMPMDIAWSYAHGNDSLAGGCSEENNNCLPIAYAAWTNGSQYALTLGYSGGAAIWFSGPGVLPFISVTTFTSGTGSERVQSINMDMSINGAILTATGASYIGVISPTDTVQDLYSIAFNHSLTLAAIELETALSSATIPSNDVAFMRLDNRTPSWVQVGDNDTDDIINLSGGRINLWATWQDNYRLDHCWLETNETGEWVNSSFTRLNRTAAQQNCSFAWTRPPPIQDTTTVGWRIHANDTQGILNNPSPHHGINSTPEGSFVVFSAAGDTFRVTAADVMSAVDNDQRTFSGTRPVSQVASFVDRDGRTFTGIRLASDVESFIDRTGRVVTVQRVASDVIVFRDSTGRVLTALRGPSDMLLVVDATGRILRAERTASDVVTMLDAVDFLKQSGANTYLVSVTEILVMLDEANRHASLARQVPDLLSVADDALRRLSAGRPSSDVVIFKDATGRTWTGSRVAGDAIALRDDRNREFIVERVAADVYTVKDSTGRTYQAIRNPDETFSVVDATGRTVTVARQGNTVVVVREDPLRTFLGERTASDSTGLVDLGAVRKVIERSVSDSLILKDVSSRTASFSRSIDDVISFILDIFTAGGVQQAPAVNDTPAAPGGGSIPGPPIFPTKHGCHQTLFEDNESLQVVVCLAGNDTPVVAMEEIFVNAYGPDPYSADGVDDLELVRAYDISLVSNQSEFLEMLINLSYDAELLNETGLRERTLAWFSYDKYSGTWMPETTYLRMDRKLVAAVVNHTSVFAVFAERRPDAPPLTTTVLGRRIVLTQAEAAAVAAVILIAFVVMFFALRRRRAKPKQAPASG